MLSITQRHKTHLTSASALTRLHIRHVHFLRGTAITAHKSCRISVRIILPWSTTVPFCLIKFLWQFQTMADSRQSIQPAFIADSLADFDAVTSYSISSFGNNQRFYICLCFLHAISVCFLHFKRGTFPNNHHTLSTQYFHCFHLLRQTVQSRLTPICSIILLTVILTLALIDTGWCTEKLLPFIGPEFFALIDDLRKTTGCFIVDDIELASCDDNLCRVFVADHRMDIRCIVTLSICLGNITRRYTYAGVFHSSIHPCAICHSTICPCAICHSIICRCTICHCTIYHCTCRAYQLPKIQLSAHRNLATIYFRTDLANG